MRKPAQRADKMLGYSIKNQSAGTARSKRVNDRERRTVKRSERSAWKRDIQAGHFRGVLR